MTKIWTLDTRDTVLLDVVMQHSQLSYADLGPELRMCHARTVEMLGSKGVSYEALRSALVPNTEPELADLALVFDRPLRRELVRHGHCRTSAPSARTRLEWEHS